MPIKDEKIIGHVSPRDLPKPVSDRVLTPDTVLAFSVIAIL